MNPASYPKFLEFFEKHSSDFLSDDTFFDIYEKLEQFIEQENLDLLAILKEALQKEEKPQIEVIIEVLRRGFWGNTNDAELFELLLKTAIDYIKLPINSIGEHELWNVKQVLDIEFHQTHIKDLSQVHEELYFQLCYEVIDPRFRKMKQSDDFFSYDGCVYFVMFSCGFYRIKNNREWIKKLKPRILLIIDEDYRRDDPFSKDWLQLFEKYPNI